MNTFKVKYFLNRIYSLCNHRRPEIVNNYHILSNTDAIYSTLKKFNVNIIDYKIDSDDFNNYLAICNYENDYPGYVQEFPGGGLRSLLHNKQLQHYLSYKLLNIREHDTYLDVASSNSCFPDILKYKFNIKNVFKQDQNYNKGIQKVDDNLFSIGSLASNIPMETNSVNCIGLHCSFEHFEGDEDIKFISEAYRILKGDGRICIIPLYMADRYTIISSPSIWKSKYRYYCEKPPVFDKYAKIIYDDSIKQRYHRSYDVESLLHRILSTQVMNMTIYYFTNYKEFNSKPFALIAEK